MEEKKIVLMIWSRLYLLWSTNKTRSKSGFCAFLTTVPTRLRSFTSFPTELSAHLSMCWWLENRGNWMNVGTFLLWLLCSRVYDTVVDMRQAVEQMQQFIRCHQLVQTNSILFTHFPSEKRSSVWRGKCVKNNSSELLWQRWNWRRLFLGQKHHRHSRISQKNLRWTNQSFQSTHTFLIRNN